MRSLPFFLLLLVCALGASVSGAQQVAFAGFVAVGGQSAAQSVAGSTASGVLLAGVYAEWLRSFVHPGLEVRGVSAGKLGFDGPSGAGISGILTGPRVAIGDGFFHPYAAVLFGPNHADATNSNAGLLSHQPFAGARRDGITTQGTIGLDFGTNPPVRLRVEFSETRFNGLPNSHPYGVTVGLVFHTADRSKRQHKP